MEIFAFDCAARNEHHGAAAPKPIVFSWADSESGLILRLLETLLPSSRRELKGAPSG